MPRSSGKDTPGALDPPANEPSGPNRLSAKDAPTVTYRDNAPTVLGVSPGQVLGGRYRVQTRLGAGGMGEVWHAFDLKLRVDVALKALRPDFVRDERRRELLRGEVRAAREVVSPNVCRIYDLEEVDGQELVSMEYVDGVTLGERLTARGPLELRAASEIAAQFLAGLEAIHQAGFVHRDIKPENLMITRAGRVVVMDFGIAKPATDGKGGTIAGTPAYMAPEQRLGEAPDVRSDIFSAGIVLAEMLGVEGRCDPTSCQALWRGARADPPELPESPWKPALLRAVARDPKDRYPSARALSRALEEVTLRVSVADDRHPYPGLASFTELQADFFFGREAEVEEIWKKLQQPHLQALIGPSGAGKSSFLRAGLIPAMPDGWSHVVCAPGSRPQIALAQALAPQLSCDPEALRELPRFEEPDVAVSVVGRWRSRHRESLVIVDQFEELFTLNPPEVQERFAELLGRLALEADVHVLLSMRDDFLMYCHGLLALGPIFSELTPLDPPAGEALRRALEQPALTCGYRFEDESLVDEMLAEVRDERGALPMLAFAAAQLWERRDRENGNLTREAYGEIGGVAGALAQHAEATLERIGPKRQPVVREIFRNLVTAQGTRAAREWDELLSVFDDRDSAGEVLRRLIDARLLTSYEAPGEKEEDDGTRRVEIVHESLLTAWPRLVRWRTQDADGAQLRDQLRQAAQMWEERDRPDDLLWTGTSYREVQLWRERYPGGLSSAEEAFNSAMTRRTARRRRRRRIGLAAAFALLVGVVAVVAWSRHQALVEARNAEAAVLFTLAGQKLEPNRTEAVAYALASLELADNPRTRRLALEALWKGPIGFALEPGDRDWRTYLQSADFSPDGRWLAVGDGSHIRFWNPSGGTPAMELEHFAFFLGFAPGSDYLVSDSVPQPPAGDGTVRVWSVADGREVRKLQFGNLFAYRFPSFLPDGRFITLRTSASAERPLRTYTGDYLFEAWSLEGGEPTTLGRMSARGEEDNPFARGTTDTILSWALDMDPGGTRLAYAQGDELYVIPFEEMGSAPPRLLARYEGLIEEVTFHPDGQRLATLGLDDQIRILSLADDEPTPPRVLRHPEGASDLRFDQGGSRLAASGPITRVWDFDGPPDAVPIAVGTAEWGDSVGSAFHPEGHWIATINDARPAVWPLGGPHPRVFPVGANKVLFAPDGSWLATTDGLAQVRIWPLTPEADEPGRVLHRAKDGPLWGLAVDPDGRRLLTSFRRPQLISLEDGQVQDLLDVEWLSRAVAFGPHGRLAAVGGGYDDSVPDQSYIRVWDLESGEVRVLDPGDGWGVLDLQFPSDRTLISCSTGASPREGAGAAPGALRVWDLETGTSEVLRDGGVTDLDLSRDRRSLVSVGFDGHVVLHDLEAGTSRTLDTGRVEVDSVALDPTATIVVAGHRDGTVSVGPVAGGSRHLLLGHEKTVSAVAVSPDGRWIASSNWEDLTMLWPMPDLRKPPFHKLPYEELLDRLRALTNLRAVPDDESGTGYRIDADRFPGWETVPTW